MNEALASAYCDKTGMDKDKLLQLMDKETWLTANQCVDLGFINHIDKPANTNSYALNAVETGIKLTPEMMEKAKAEMNKKAENEALKKSLMEDLDSYGV